MSVPYEERMYQCPDCGEYFTREDMIEDGSERHCKYCYAALIKERQI